MSIEAKKAIQNQIEAKNVVIIAARDESHAGQQIVNLRKQILVLEQTLGNLRGQRIDRQTSGKMISLTSQLVLLQETYNQSIYWLKRNQPALFERLQLPTNVTIIDLSGSVLDENTQQAGSEEYPVHSNDSEVEESNNDWTDNQLATQENVSTEMRSPVHASICDENAGNVVNAMDSNVHLPVMEVETENWLLVRASVVEEIDGNRGTPKDTNVHLPVVPLESPTTLVIPQESPNVHREVQMPVEEIDVSTNNNLTRAIINDTITLEGIGTAH
jgi:hypothetical protein